MTDAPPAAPVLDPRLDRLVRFDPRSRDYPVTAVLPAAAARAPRSYTWSVPVHLDQKAEGACVGFARAHATAARPRSRPMVEDDARLLYHRARQLDDWDGESYEGSSVLGGAKAAQERGWLTEYRWAFSVEELAAGVGYTGSAVIGVDWLEGMSQPDDQGYIHATGALLGGHSTLIYAVNHRRRDFGIWQSWGLNWGIAGTCRISFSDMDLLLHRRGEACFATKPAFKRARPAPGGTP